MNPSLPRMACFDLFCFVVRPLSFNLNLFCISFLTPVDWPVVHADLPLFCVPPFLFWRSGLQADT